jgi:predicted nuclease with TOPRIM domain
MDGFVPEPAEGADMTSTELARERAELLDRLQNLRAIVPVFAQELASERRQAARLRQENKSLTEQVRRLQKEYGPVRRLAPREEQRAGASADMRIAV